jgi:hypothetical protein
MYYMRRLTTFGEKYGVPTLLDTHLLHRPASPVIPILWTVSDYTLQQPKRTKNNVTYNSARALQSAASAFNSWTLVLSNPDTMYRSPDNRILGGPRLGPTDSLVATLTNAGMRRRLGTETRPSVALPLQHILFNQEFRAQQVTGNPDSVAAWQYASANSAELFAWCGWNRAEQNFQLQTEDVTFCLPEHGEHFALPPGVGALFLRLAPETKYSPDKQADVILSSYCASGLQPLSGCETYTAKPSHLSSFAIRMGADGQLEGSAIRIFTLC